ncbi:16S rRNA (guanine(527)-N(7))-methyltransferase RsmG [Undibacterium sp. LX40W]|uniref:Ribosomal RNA small subunit methyltransferase G n=1 Tax=Undibacterium nitidum TaxID=2762298 RepID=A0A923KQI2_9BURK|nr:MULTISPECIES: 16S rRNA (guanine(527)-N(7))-methyltransferase RsmG [Undibacterium]MBC3882963.1 16S rRNA (guanine(527)-N(7))-methyltransferase RsmG [Undibacterium nitidum]MBC3893244.1 16S rRNA (guanine(527)-N(7))-methyltransferase RsmG [Undibacterium sp. LX40W]
MKGFDKVALGAELSAGVASLGLPITEEQIEKMLAYLALLVKWNSVYNLTSIRDPQDMIKQHLLDSLSAVHAFTQAKHVLDVGSGGGLPGIILAIVFPSTSISMIDTVNKKTAFLTQVKAELKLKNVTVHTGRVELLKVEQKFDVITSRAFSELNNFVNWSHHLLQEGGRFLAMKGVSPDQEIERLPDGWEVENIEALHVPGLHVERHLVVIRKSEN